MKPVRFKEANVVLKAPPGMTKDECGDLHVHHMPDVGCMVSKWLPTDEERAAIARGEPVWLYVYAKGHPPVALEAGDPFMAPP